MFSSSDRGWKHFKSILTFKGFWRSFYSFTERWWNPEKTSSFHWIFLKTEGFEFFKSRIFSGVCQTWKYLCWRAIWKGVFQVKGPWWNKKLFNCTLTNTHLHNARIPTIVENHSWMCFSKYCSELLLILILITWGSRATTRKAPLLKQNMNYWIESTNNQVHPTRYVP